jgi:hypothetical protein
MGYSITAELLETIDNYLKGNLSKVEHLAFEKQMEENKELEEIVLIQRQLFAIHDFETTKNKLIGHSQKNLLYYKEQLRSKENQHLSAKIRKIGENYTKPKTSKQKSYLKYYIAASIALVFATIIMLNSNTSLEDYYYDNVNWNELPSYIDKGQAENDFSKGEIAFKNSEYKKAIISFSSITSESELYPYSLLYIGASYEQLQENDKALEIFDQLSALSDFEENSRAYWYKLLIYAKLNDKTKAKEMQTIILENKNNYNYEQVHKLDL